MPQSLSVVYLHLVFSTKDRRPWLRDRQIREALHAHLGEVSTQLFRLAEVVTFSVRFKRTVGDSLDEELPVAFEEKLSDSPDRTRQMRTHRAVP